MQPKLWLRKRYMLLLPFFIMGMYKVLLITHVMVENAMSYAAYPLLKIQQKLADPLRTFFVKNETRNALEQQIKHLQHERDALLAENITLQATMAHYEGIKEVLEYKHHYDQFDVRLVTVLARNISDQSHFFLIDAGSNAGITKNMIAVYKNGLVGKVEEVYPLYSKVILITDRSCKVAAMCIKTGAEGIFEGCNKEGRALLNRVSHLASIEADDLVVSTGKGLIFPQGFGLGRIKTFQRDLITYAIEIEPLFDFHVLNYCFLITGLKTSI